MPFALVAARALQFWALAILFGGGGLLLLLKQRDHSQALRVAALVAVVSGIAWLALVFVGVTGDPAALMHLDAWRVFFISPFGLPWAIRLCLLVAYAIAALQRHVMPFVAVSLGAILDQAWLGHAATGTGSIAAPMILSYWIHVLAGFAWVGGLTMLCLLIARRRWDSVRAGLALFSSVGIVLVAAILASGVLNASFRIASANDLFATDYGRILMAKVGMFAAMLGLAFFNRRQGTRRLGYLSISVTVETLLGVGVLLAAAMLGVTEPPG